MTSQINVLMKDMKCTITGNNPRILKCEGPISYETVNNGELQKSGSIVAFPPGQGPTSNIKIPDMFKTDIKTSIPSNNGVKKATSLPVNPAAM